MKPSEIVAAAFYVAIAVFSLYYGAKVISMEPHLPCGIAGISPDFDNKHREQCRQARGYKL
jgi:hypothetical protein